MSEGADEGGAPRAPAAERSGDAEEAPPLREPRRPAKAPEGGLRERKPSPSAREAGAAARRPAPAPAGAPAGAGASEKDRKDLMKMVVQQNKKQAAQTADTCAVVVGTAQCGKSTLLKGLLNKDEEPQATLALEYSYCSKTTQGRKDIAHIWEVGGGTAMQNLLDVALTESSVRTATVVIVADLSKPEEVFAGVSYWLSRLRARLQDIDKELKKKETTAKVMDQLRERSAKKFGERWMDQLKSRPAKEDGADKKESTAHPDQKLVMHTGVNVVIVATKWDSFAKKDPDLLKVMGRCLRFLAHSNGASLVYCGKGDKVLVDKFRAVLSHHLFRTPPIKSTETNHLKPLLVPAGTDTLRDIGLPSVDKSMTEVATKPEDLWKRVFEGYFCSKCKDGKSPELPTGPAALPDVDPDRKYEEKAVDSALHDKELELKLHRDSQKSDRLEERSMARAGAPKPVARRASSKAAAPPPG